jgi:hypothetical protein
MEQLFRIKRFSESGLLCYFFYPGIIDHYYLGTSEIFFGEEAIRGQISTQISGIMGLMSPKVLKECWQVH